MQPTICFNNLLLNLKVFSVAGFVINLLKVSFEQTDSGFLFYFYLEDAIENQKL